LKIEDGRWKMGKCNVTTPTLQLLHYSITPRLCVEG